MMELLRVSGLLVLLAALSSPCASEDTCDALGETNSCTFVRSVFERDLLQRTPSYQSILQEEKRHSSDVDTKRFAGETLGYVTPWNNHGYDTAKLFRSKFTYISPVWYQIRHSDHGKPILTGGHDVDVGWIAAVRGKVAGPHIVPRFMFEMNSLSPQESTRIVQLIRQEVKSQGFDGITLEIPVLQVTFDLIRSLGQALKEDGHLFILVLPTSQRNGQLTTPTELIAKVLPFVHRFSMNAYDYSSMGPNAPLPWLKATLEALKPLKSNEKFLIGLAFYGYDTRDPIVASKYRELLETHRPAIEWDGSAHECFFRYPNQHVVYYPCLQSIQDRLELYTSAQTGAAVWDIGQGLDYFFDLL
ncbi:hypothetical protein, variant 1 [Aphanomyces invadans]|uniref:Chitinase domain-containing protein 1 n=1 Tax=Aphanomyces invadans TaxID=157072 RepID=A0A024TWG8_9STRA|nr:hypothetical protein, variant 1 [Aphanomyces invadans]ETV98329.1 hypothetical protein, variant 1 [Aphanomyces invadans]|eukprot:XP_008873204.1 hypothetical protein, variant 1 [Aphanomyces invadans]